MVIHQRLMGGVMGCFSLSHYVTVSTALNHKVVIQFGALYPGSARPA